MIECIFIWEKNTRTVQGIKHKAQKGHRG